MTPANKWQKSVLGYFRVTLRKLHTIDGIDGVLNSMRSNDSHTTRKTEIVSWSITTKSIIITHYHVRAKRTQHTTIHSSLFSIACVSPIRDGEYPFGRIPFAIIVGICNHPSSLIGRSPYYAKRPLCKMEYCLQMALMPKNLTPNDFMQNDPCPSQTARYMFYSGNISS